MGVELVVIGCSWGGLAALNTIFAGLPVGLDVAIAVAQHRMAQSADGLAGSLQKHSLLPISEAEDKTPIVPGTIYLAPPDYHLIVEPGSFALSTDQAVQYARPSIDVLFESAADSYGDALVGVILTGANDDGAAGLKHVRELGGRAVVQDPSSAVRPEMPAAALATVRSARVLPLESIAPYLVELCRHDVAATGDR